MFLIRIRYTAPLEEIDRLMADHVQFLEECFRAGVFIAAGRQIPRNGGVILARADSSSDVEEIMEHDPFISERVATFELTEFRTSFYHPDFAPFADQGVRGTRAVTGIPAER